MIAVVVLLQVCLRAAESAGTGKLDPAKWGSDHVGKEVPEYMTGGECLFCHGKKVGVNWQRNPHQLTMRPALPDSDEVKALATFLKVGEKPEYLLGHEEMVRYLRKGEGYGKAELHSHSWNPHSRKISKAPAAVWDPETFGENCAGCHATGVDSKLQAFSALSIDCYACHGELDPKHTADSALMLLSPKRGDPARVTTSICAQCHLRTGKSRSTGRPYPNNFVPGDNLFRDFEVSFEPKAIAALNPADRHIHENVREVVLGGDESMNCLTCHEVHKSSTSRHERLPRTSAICATCHESKDGKWTTNSYEVHSKVCGY